MLIPSICIEPDVKSTSLNNATPSDDLPEPVRPTMPKYTSKLIIYESAKNGKCYKWQYTYFFFGFNVKRDVVEDQWQIGSITHFYV